MKFTIFASAVAAVAVADELSWYEGEMFGQVDAEALDFGEAFDDAADFFIQIGAEERNSLGQVLLQTKAKADDFIANMTPASREIFDNMYAQTRKSAFNWLSQIDQQDRARVGEMLSQTGYGQYFMQQGVNEEVADQINTYFSQLSWTEEPEQETDLVQVDADSATDAELSDMADMLAELDDETMERLNALVQAKKEEYAGEEF